MKKLLKISLLALMAGTLAQPTSRTPAQRAEGTGARLNGAAVQVAKIKEGVSRVAPQGKTHATSTTAAAEPAEKQEVASALWGASAEWGAPSLWADEAVVA